MCTLSWLPDKDGYSLIFNRDELNSRQRALPPTHKKSYSGTHFLSPTDTDAGGSWLMVNEHGLTACLINFYPADKAASEDIRSRGEIVLKLIDCQSIVAAERIVETMDNSHYKGFDLVLFDRRGVPLQYRWDSNTLMRKTPAASMTSSSYRISKVCRYRHDLFLHTAPKNLQQLLALHKCHNPTDIPAPTSAYPFCMHREDAKTVSQCVVAVNSEQVSIRYADGSPCSSPLSPPLTLQSAQQQEEKQPVLSI